MFLSMEASLFENDYHFRIFPYLALFKAIFANSSASVFSSLGICCTSNNWKCFASFLMVSLSLLRAIDFVSYTPFTAISSIQQAMSRIISSVLYRAADLLCFTTSSESNRKVHLLIPWPWATLIPHNRACGYLGIPFSLTFQFVYFSSSDYVQYIQRHY